ncbi:MAG: M56 family metallopeptidase [Allobaculum sp.]
MYFSLSSFLNTIVFSAIMIALLLFLVRQGKGSQSVQSGLLVVLVFLIAIRLFFPVELRTAKVFLTPKIINPIHNFLNTKLAGDFSVMHLLFGIWLGGCAVQTIRFLRQFYLISEFFKELEPSATKKHLSDFFKVEKRHDYPVWISDQVSSPMVLGFKNIILLPELDLSQEDLEKVLIHEMDHLRHHDHWLKQVLNVLMIIYWWFPPVYALCDKIQAVLEIRTDEHATSDYSKDENLDYNESLDRFNQALITSGHSGRTKFSSHFALADSNSQLIQRTHYRTRNQYSKAMNIFVLCIITLLPLISYSFILQASYLPPEIEQYFTEVDPKNALLVRHKDGTYNLNADGISIELPADTPPIKGIRLIIEN